MDCFFIKKNKTDCIVRFVLSTIAVIFISLSNRQVKGTWAQVTEPSIYFTCLSRKKES